MYLKIPSGFKALFFREISMQFSNFLIKGINSLLGVYAVEKKEVANVYLLMANAIPADLNLILKNFKKELHV